MAGLGMDRRRVPVLVGPTLGKRDAVVDLIGAGLPADVAAVEGDQLGVPYSTGGDLIAQAREAGRIPPTTPGRISHGTTVGQ